MIATRRDRSTNNIFQRGASARHIRSIHEGVGQRPSQDGVPALTKCNSGSTTSSSQGTKKNQQQSSDRSILRGAEILRRQLSNVGSAASSKLSSPSSRRRKNAEREDWDPWRIPASSSLVSQENRQEDISTKGDSQHRTDPSRKGDQPQQNNDEDTVKLLERAKALYQNMTFSGPSVQHQAQHNKKAYVQKGKEKEDNKNDVVKRVSEMDNGTFASNGDVSYLPTHLLSGTSQSPSNNSVTRRSPPNDSPNLVKPIPSSRSRNVTQVQDSDEAIETSTLDFLANLHVKDDDISTILNFDDGMSSVTGSSFHVESRADVSVRQKSAASSPTSSRHGNFPCITKAAAPFQNMIAPCSYIYDELLRDPAYQHAVRAGALWQSLCSQHVRFPSLWWDGQEPGAPPFGTPEKNLWTYMGRHRVKDDRKLNSLIGNRGSSGRLLLHIVVRDIVTLEPIEDICCGCFHPNARGVRTTRVFDPRMEDCRDVWIGHRRRGKAKSSSSTIESLLRHQNKGRVDASPLGGEAAKKKKNGGIDNGNLNAVFGDKPPLSTVMVLESDLYQLFQSQLNGSSPASIVLLRRFLRHRVG